MIDARIDLTTDSDRDLVLVACKKGGIKVAGQNNQLTVSQYRAIAELVVMLADYANKGLPIGERIAASRTVDVSEDDFRGK